MSEQEKKHDGPDFSREIPLGDLAESSMILGQVTGETVVQARSCGALRDRRGVHPLPRPTRREDAGGGYRPLPAAPRRLQLAHWRGIAPPGAQSGVVLADRAAGAEKSMPAKSSNRRRAGRGEGPGIGAELRPLAKGRRNLNAGSAGARHADQPLIRGDQGVIAAGPEAGHMAVMARRGDFSLAAAEGDARALSVDGDDGNRCIEARSRTVSDPRSVSRSPGFRWE